MATEVEFRAYHLLTLIGTHGRYGYNSSEYQNALSVVFLPRPDCFATSKAFPFRTLPACAALLMLKAPFSCMFNPAHNWSKPMACEDLQRL